MCLNRDFDPGSLTQILELKFESQARPDRQPWKCACDIQLRQLSSPAPQQHIPTPGSPPHLVRQSQVPSSAAGWWCVNDVLYAEQTPKVRGLRATCASEGERGGKLEP